MATFATQPLYLAIQFRVNGSHPRVEQTGPTPVGYAAQKLEMIRIERLTELIRPAAHAIVGQQTGGRYV